MSYTIENLGPIAWGDRCMLARHGIDPATGEEVALVSLSRGGFLVIRPQQPRALQVPAPKPFTEWWAIAQAPDGPVYQVEYNGGVGDSCITRWDWDGEASIVAHVPGKAFFTCDVAPDGRVYAPEYSKNTMCRYDPATGEVDTPGEYGAFGDHIRDVACGADGLVYVTGTDYTQTCVVVLDPESEQTRKLEIGDAEGLNVNWGSLSKDSHGRACVPATKWGRSLIFEARDGTLHSTDQREVARADGMLAFRDGGYLKELEEVPHLGESSPDGEIAVTYIDPDGATHEFSINRKGVPLRIFSVACELDRVWAGTFIPLTLASYDPLHDRRYHYGNPSETDGEIYTMIEASGKLLIGSYCGAVFTRFDPDHPWQRDGAITDNPAHLGRMREEREMQRPYGVTKDERGFAYFAAMGGYGVPDSGICRIDPRTGQLDSWIFENTTFTMLEYVTVRDQLVVAERRDGDPSLRLTFVCPQDGHEIQSDPIIEAPGEITDLLYDGEDTLYGLHAWAATVFAYRISQGKIIAKQEEVGLGHHLYDTFTFAPDGRVWGVTAEVAYTFDRQLQKVEILGRYDDEADGSFYRFGAGFGPDGHFYFPNGPHLMRLRVEG